MQESPVGSPRLIRQLNLSLALRTIRERGPISRSDIAKVTGLSKPTVSEVVEMLLRTDYLQETQDIASSRPGPRARLLTFNAEQGHIVGIDIGADKLLVMVANLAGDIVGSHRRSTGVRAQVGRDAVLEEVRQSADAALEDAGISRSSLVEVAVGTPGVVDPGSGRVTIAPQLRGWEGIQLDRSLAPFFPCEVLVENEVHLAVLAERWRGAAQHVDDVVYIQAGVGIGAGILIGGKIYRGADGAAGEIGSLPIPDPSMQSEGGLGTFEYTAGGGAFARLGSAALIRGESEILTELAGGDPALVDARLVFEAARQGDEAAIRIIDELTARLAQGIAATITVLNPTRVIVGGGLSHAESLFLEPLRKSVTSLVPITPEIVLSELGEEVVALGAVRLGMQAVEQRLFEPFAEPSWLGEAIGSTG